MRPERPHPLLLIVFLLGISALITGCETFALHQTAPKPLSPVRSKITPVGKSHDLIVLSPASARHS
jgi:hypothetical protein